MAISRYSSFSVIFFVLGPTFLTLGPFLGATPLPKKKTNLIFWKTILCWTFWKKTFSNIIKNKGPRPTLKIVGKAISSHIINFWFLPFSGHFRTLGEIFFASSRRRKISWCWRKKNWGDISSGSDFIADPKKSLFRYIYKYYIYFLISIVGFFHLIFHINPIFVMRPWKYFLNVICC